MTVLDFEAARDLTPALADTRHLIDCVVIRESAVTGLRDRIEHLDDLIAGTPSGTRRAMYVAAKETAERQLAMVRAWNPAGLIPRSP